MVPRYNAVLKNVHVFVQWIVACQKKHTVCYCGNVLFVIPVHTHKQHKHRLFSTPRTAVNRPGHSCINAVRQARVRFPPGTAPLVTR